MLVVIWARLPQVEKSDNESWVVFLVFQMVANFATAVFTCQRRLGVFISINKSCCGSLSNSHKLKGTPLCPSILYIIHFTN